MWWCMFDSNDPLPWAASVVTSASMSTTTTKFSRPTSSSATTVTTTTTTTPNSPPGPFFLCLFQSKTSCNNLQNVLFGSMQLLPGVDMVWSDSAKFRLEAYNVAESSLSVSVFVANSTDSSFAAMQTLKLRLGSCNQSNILPVCVCVCVWTIIFIVFFFLFSYMVWMYALKPPRHYYPQIRLKYFFTFFPSVVYRGCDGQAVRNSQVFLNSRLKKNDNKFLKLFFHLETINSTNDLFYFKRRHCFFFVYFSPSFFAHVIFLSFFYP